MPSQNRQSSRSPMGSILERDLIYVTGKGGVGRSTVSAALGLVAARRGRRTIVCEVAEQDRLSRAFGRPPRTGDEEAELADGLWGVSIDPQRALREWLGAQLGSRALSRLLFESNAFTYFAAAAPGAREIATLVKVWDLARPDRWQRGASGYDLVVVDGPASGHGLGMLRTPRTFSEIARLGPIHAQVERVGRMLYDGQRTGYLAVALPEEMPVNETLELERALPEVVGGGLSGIVVNGLYPRRFEAEDLARAAAVAERREDGALRLAVAAARAEHQWAEGQREQLGRLEEGAKAPLFTLPFLFAGELGPAELRQLSDRLETAGI